jgi:hypothetical protein
MFPYPKQGHWIFISASIAAIFGYAGTVSFGIPHSSFCASVDVLKFGTQSFSASLLADQRGRYFWSCLGFRLVIR